MQKQVSGGLQRIRLPPRKLDKNLPDPNVAAALMYDQLENGRQGADRRSIARWRRTRRTRTRSLHYAQWLIKSDTPESIAKAEAMLAEARKANPGNLNLLILSGVAARMSKKMKPAEDYFIEALRHFAPATAT